MFKKTLSQFAKPVSAHRRSFVQKASLGAASLAFTSLSSKTSVASVENSLLPKPYGDLLPTKDLTTGLELLALPRGFEYRSFGWTGQTMSDGFPTPTDHDGMAVVARQGRRIAMVRNHEVECR